MALRWIVPVCALVLGGCGIGDVDVVEPATPAAAAPRDGGAPPPTVAPTVAAGSAPAPAVAAEPTPEPAFAATVAELTEAELGASWREDCPVPVTALRRIDLRHWDDAGLVQDGALVVHVDHVDDVITVFARLFEARFPIHSMRPISAFDGDDDASMAANNSSAFNCRTISGRPGVWSQHSYGGAIDLNPLVNPWVRGDRVDPPGGEAYVDRTGAVPGLIVAGDVVTSAFAAIGWTWGGDWSETVDYQHFSHNGG